MTLSRYFPEPHAGQLPQCDWYTHLDVYIGTGDELRGYDEEVRERGRNIWSREEAGVFIGDRDEAAEAFGAVEVVETNYGDWLILYDADWLRGVHYARQLGQTRTPSGNTLWYLADGLVAFPGDCPDRFRPFPTSPERNLGGEGD